MSRLTGFHDFVAVRSLKQNVFFFLHVATIPASMQKWSQCGLRTTDPGEDDDAPPNHRTSELNSPPHRTTSITRCRCSTTSLGWAKRGEVGLQGGRLGHAGDQRDDLCGLSAAGAIDRIWLELGRGVVCVLCGGIPKKNVQISWDFTDFI